MRRSAARFLVAGLLVAALVPVAAGTHWWSAPRDTGFEDDGAREASGSARKLAPSPPTDVSGNRRSTGGDREGLLAKAGVGGVRDDTGLWQRESPLRAARRSRVLPALPREAVTGSALFTPSAPLHDEAQMPDLSFSEVARDRRGLLAHVRGRDRAAPRELGLWRVSPTGEGAALLARGRSEPDGRFAFERLLVPPSRVELVVAALSDSRFEATAYGVAALAPLPLQAPAVTAGEYDPWTDSWRLRVYAASGALLALDDPAGATRRPVRLPLRFAAQRAPGLWVDAPRGDTLWLSQRARDGRRSRWVAIQRGSAGAAGSGQRPEADLDALASDAEAFDHSIPTTQGFFPGPGSGLTEPQ